MKQRQYGVFSLPVIVGALGFFVDLYDILLFNIVRRPSFIDLGVPASEMKRLGENTISWQMLGLTIGGILWGMMGDKKGRKSVLFGSILLYSLATIANGFVTNVDQYIVLRFIAGLGLAGELGASVTLIFELLSKEKRGIASTFISTSGAIGAIAAYFVYKLSGGNWRLCYFIGGGMGLALLFLRMAVLESSMYDMVKRTTAKLGNYRMLLNNRERFFRYLRCILIGLPFWYIAGLLITFSDEFAKQFGISDFDPSRALMFQFVGLVVGDICAGLLSYKLKSRKKPLLVYYAIISLFICLFFILKGGGGSFNMYLICAGLGFGSGIAVLYTIISAESFGTNLRATTAVSVPNMVRGFLPLMLLLFRLLRSKGMFDDYVTAAWITGVVVIVVGFTALLYTKESYGKDMDFIEQ